MKKNTLIPKNHRKLRQNEIIRFGDLRVSQYGDSFTTRNPGKKVCETMAKQMGSLYARQIKGK